MKTAYRKNIRNEIEFEIEMFRTDDKKAKRKAFEKLQRLDILSYHYFAQEYDALKSSYVIFLLYLRYNRRRYLCGTISLHISGMNKILRNIFFGSEFFGKFRRYMIDTYGVKAKFVTISRFVLFPQFRGVGLARKFVELVVEDIKKMNDVFLIEIFSSMLYNFDFMPEDWIKYSNVVRSTFNSNDEYAKFCSSAKLVRTLETARKVLNRALKRVDDGGRVRAADLPCSQIQSQAVRTLRAAGETDLLNELDSKKRNQTFRSMKQAYKRIPRTDRYVDYKSSSMYDRMDEANQFVNIASYMFYIPVDKFRSICEYFQMHDVDYSDLLIQHLIQSELFIDKMKHYFKRRNLQIPIFVDMFMDNCNIDSFRILNSILHSEQLQKTKMKAKLVVDDQTEN